MSKSETSTRFFESLVSGHPMHSHIKTPDGRILLELHRQGEADERRHHELQGIQRDLVDSLRSSNRGQETMAKADFAPRSEELLPAFREATDRLGQLHHTQAELLDEARVLNTVAAAGFSHLGDQMTGVRDEVRGVRDDLLTVGDAITGEIQSTARMTQGAALPQASLTELSARSGMFLEALSAYTKGLLSSSARQELERLMDQRLASFDTKVRTSEFIAKKVAEQVEVMREKDPDQEDDFGWKDLERRTRRGATAVTSIIENPHELITNPTGAEEKLERLIQVLRVFPDEGLAEFVRGARSMLSLAKKAQVSPVSGEFLVELTSSGLTTDGVSHEVKRTRRAARVGGTAIDRNYNLMELLDQGDHASGQRDRLLAFAERQTTLGELRAVQGATLITQGAHAGVQRQELLGQGAHAGVQRDQLIGFAGRQVALSEEDVRQGIAAAEQREEQIELAQAAVLIGAHGLVHLRNIDASLRVRDRGTEHVVDRLVETNGHLVNLERLGEEFIEVMEGGFKRVDRTLVRGFNAVNRGLDRVATEIAISRAAVAGQLRHMEQTIALGFDDISARVDQSNQLLERLIGLQEESLRNEAVQRCKEGLLRLKNSRTPDDFRRAAEVFERGVERDSSLVENQFGLASALESAGDNEAAKRWYRETGLLAAETRKELSIAAWSKFSELEETDGNLPSAIEGMRAAVALDTQNPILSFRLARLLGQVGLEDEAENILLALIDRDTKFLLKLKLDQAFHEDFLGRIYKKIWTSGWATRIGLNGIQFLLEEFVRLEEDELALEVFRYVVTRSPRLILNKLSRYDSTSSAFQAGMIQMIRDLISGTANRFAAEDWYAISYIALHLSFDPSLISTAFTKGLAHDTTYLRGDRESVKRRLQVLDAQNYVKLASFLSSVNPDFQWLNQ